MKKYWLRIVFAIALVALLSLTACNGVDDNSGESDYRNLENTYYVYKKGSLRVQPYSDDVESSVKAQQYLERAENEFATYTVLFTKGVVSVLLRGDALAQGTYIQDKNHVSANINEVEYFGTVSQHSIVVEYKAEGMVCSMVLNFNGIHIQTPDSEISPEQMVIGGKFVCRETIEMTGMDEATASEMIQFQNVNRTLFSRGIWWVFDNEGKVLLDYREVRDYDTTKTIGDFRLENNTLSVTFRCADEPEGSLLREGTYTWRVGQQTVYVEMAGEKLGAKFSLVYMGKWTPIPTAADYTGKSFRYSDKSAMGSIDGKYHADLTETFDDIYSCGVTLTFTSETEYKLENHLLGSTAYGTYSVKKGIAHLTQTNPNMTNLFAWETTVEMNDDALLCTRTRQWQENGSKEKITWEMKLSDAEWQKPDHPENTQVVGTYEYVIGSTKQYLDSEFSADLTEAAEQSYSAGLTMTLREDGSYTLKLINTDSCGIYFVQDGVLHLYQTQPDIDGMCYCKTTAKIENDKLVFTEYVQVMPDESQIMLTWEMLLAK